MSNSLQSGLYDVQVLQCGKKVLTRSVQALLMLRQAGAIVRLVQTSPFEFYGSEDASYSFHRKHTLAAIHTLHC